MKCKYHFFHRLKNAKGIWFHIAGIIALFWFLIRVVPKPTRSQYPCQQMAIPIALGYVAFWSAIFYGTLQILKKTQRKTTAILPIALSFFILVGSITGFGFANIITTGPTYEPWNPLPNQPVGEPQGLSPGRVVWTWNPDATEKELDGYWWNPQNNDQAVINDMMAEGIKNLANTESISEAWNELFSYVNEKNNQENQEYQSGEHIAIKVNLNNCWNPFDFTDDYKRVDNERDAHPAVVNALLTQLVNQVGVDEQDIIIYDVSRPIPDWFYDPVYSEFPNVNFVDAYGGADGRAQAAPSEAKIYFAEGPTRTLPTCVVESSYIINIPILKQHPINHGVTLSGKNMFGTFIEPVADLHPYHESGQFMGNAAPQTDLFAHEEIGQKTVLFLGDGLFATLRDHRTITRFQMYPFNDDWTNSLFFSQDPVAIDSVMYDFLHTEGPIPLEGSQNYLHQAAKPPENTYDPEQDGIFISDSLGVHEHWNPNVPIFSSDRYTTIDFVPLGTEHASSTIVFEKPSQGSFYLFDESSSVKIWYKDYYKFPFTIAIGPLTVNASFNGEFSDTIDAVDFYVDNQHVYSDESFPFSWKWDSFSAGFHTLKVEAFADGTIRSSASQEVFKLF
ncbi:MAG: DUF362 domain-containing protein [Candidatus Thermoplasmatota archaeon]|nr:DUF362 domain-containing protein [Candidatus Thermoplasmatota archaeon]